MSKPNSNRPQSNGKGKPIQVQTLQFDQQLPQQQNQQQQQQKPIAKPKLVKQPTSTPNNNNEFENFMQQKLQESHVKRIYDQKDEQLQKVTSKPFQIQRSTTKPSEQEVQSITSSTSNRKPYNKFYSNIRSVDTSVPARGSGKVQENPSFASTDKSYDISNLNNNEEEEECVLSENRSSGSSQSFRNFVQQKQQQQQQQEQQQIDFSKWRVNEPRSEKFYQSALEKIEQIIKNRNDKRKEYIGELERYIGGLPEQKLGTQERMNMLQKISEQPLDKLSSQQIKNRSMFVTELLRSRNEPIDNVSSVASEVSERMEMQKKKFEDVQSYSQLDPGMQDRLDQLLEGVEDYVSGSYDVNENPYKMESWQIERWEGIHNGIRKYNKDYSERDELFLDGGCLPKDKFLKQQAEKRILKQKMDDVNTAMMDLLDNKNKEDRFKIKDLAASMLKKQQGKPQKNEYLERQFNELEGFEQINIYLLLLSLLSQEAKHILNGFDVNRMLRELEELKSDLDQAIMMSNSLNAQIEQSAEYQQSELIRVKQQEIVQIELECGEINERAERLFRMEESLRLQLKYQESQQQDQEEEEMKVDNEAVIGKSLEDYDREMESRAKDQLQQQYPEMNMNDENEGNDDDEEYKQQEY